MRTELFLWLLLSALDVAMADVCSVKVNTTTKQLVDCEGERCASVKTLLMLLQSLLQGERGSSTE